MVLFIVLIFYVQIIHFNKLFLYFLLYILLKYMIMYSKENYVIFFHPFIKSYYSKTFFYLYNQEMENKYAYQKIFLPILHLIIQVH